MTWRGWEHYNPDLHTARQEAPPVLVSAKRQKYGAERTTLNGIAFASKKEARRYAELRIREAAGEIRDLELQPGWTFEIHGVVIGSYRADFKFIDVATGRVIVEDVKSAATKKARDYPLRKKLLKALFGIEITEV